ncbi:MAG: ABC transporter ATP-binding protein/permease [Clostridia bacterium]|nr:ABC transporter ATP-binding protein/permease [Clostridia bacterium]
MFKLLKYTKKKDWLFAVLAVGFIVVQVWLELKMPDYMNIITQIAQGKSSMGNTTYELSDIWSNGGKMLLCALGSMVSSVITSFFVVSVAADFSARVREALYVKVQGFSNNEINKFSTASLITRSTNDVQQVQTLITMGLQLMIKAPITAVWAILKIAGKQWQWSTALAVAVGFMVIAIMVIMSLVVKKFKKIQKLTDDINRVTRENLTGIRVIRAYNAEKYQEEKFEETNEDMTNTQLYTGRVMACIGPIMSMVMNGIALAIYWIGAYLINNSDIFGFQTLFGDMVVYMAYGMQIIASFMMLSMMFMLAPRSLVSAKRINEVLSTDYTVKDGKGVGETKQQGTVEFKNVSFSYPDGQSAVLSNISLKINKGETVAFIGSTGCGKTSLVNLIPRFYDANEGEVLVDGENVKNYKKEELAKKIGYVSQKAVLFSGDIASNINFGDNNADENAVNEALLISQSEEFVKTLDEGVYSHVAQSGQNFSGGQKQRLSIARALARRSEIFIFDDTFSALDYKTDRILRDALKENMKGTTLIIVAQRIGTIIDADKIFVVDNGEIVGEGTHKELLKTCDTYKEIAQSQLSEEELNYARNEL